MANNTKKWVIDRKFKDIEEMHKKLAKKLSNMPYLPVKSIFRLGEDDLDKRKDELEKYLNVLASRKDILSDPEFKIFLDLERHIRSEHLTVVKDLNEISNLPMSVKDYIYSPSKGILFLLLTETRVVSKIGTLITSLSKSQDVSLVYAYREEPLGSLEFTKLWQYGLSLEGTMLSWDEGLTLLAIGFANGMIECVRVSTELNYTKYSPFCKIHCHTQNVSGIIFLSDTGHLISCSTDKYLVKTDIANNEAHIAEKEHPYPLTTMLMDKQNRRFFLADSVGTIFVYCPSEKFTLLATIPFHKENFVKSLFFDKHRSLLIAGSNQGLIVVYEIGKPGREKFSVYTTSFEGIKQIRSIYFIGQNKELFLANAVGTVGFINSLTTIPFHMLDAHDGEITKMSYIENKKLLVTAGVDRSIKFWRYPFDPEEKLPSKKPYVTKISASAIPSYEPQSRPVGLVNENNHEDHSGSDENSPREPITLFQYRPAKEPVEEDDEEEEKKSTNLTQQERKESKANSSKDEEGDNSDYSPEQEVQKVPKIKKRPEHPLASDSEKDEDDDEVKKKQEQGKASPKSFLFKNSLYEVVKKEDIRNLEKKKEKKQDQDQEKTKEIKMNKNKEDPEKSNNPLLKENSVNNKKITQEKSSLKDSETKEVNFQEVQQAKQPSSMTEKSQTFVEDRNSSLEKPTATEPKRTKTLEKNETSNVVVKQNTVSKDKNSKEKSSEAEDPLQGPGIRITNKESSDPKKTSKNDSKQSGQTKNSLQAKRKQLRKPIMDDDDDDDLLDFQGLKAGTKLKESKAKKNDSDEEGLAGWAQ